MAEQDNLHFESYEEAAEWFDTNDMADYADQLKPVEFHFDLRKNRDWVELDHDLAQKIRQIAKQKGISSRLLVHQWLSQQIHQS